MYSIYVRSFFSYKVLLRGKPVSGDPRQDGSLLLDEIEPTRKKWKLGKTKVNLSIGLKLPRSSFRVSENF